MFKVVPINVLMWGIWQCNSVTVCQERITAPIVLSLWLEGRWWSLPVTRFLTSIVMIIVNTNTRSILSIFLTSHNPTWLLSNISLFHLCSILGSLSYQFSMSLLALFSKNSDHASYVEQSNYCVFLLKASLKEWLKERAWEVGWGMPCPCWGLLVFNRNGRSWCFDDI